VAKRRVRRPRVQRRRGGRRPPGRPETHGRRRRSKHCAAAIRAGQVPTTVVGARARAIGRSLPPVGRHLETFPHVDYGRTGTGALARTVVGTHSRGRLDTIDFLIAWPASNRPRWRRAGASAARRTARQRLSHIGLGQAELPGDLRWFAVRNETALFTGRRESRSTLVRWVSCQFGSVSRWRPRSICMACWRIGGKLLRPAGLRR
jgi:hypothetical protein